jgi:hypothetical protein
MPLAGMTKPVPKDRANKSSLGTFPVGLFWSGGYGHSKVISSDLWAKTE